MTEPHLFFGFVVAVGAFGSLTFVLYKRYYVANWTQACRLAGGSVFFCAMAVAAMYGVYIQNTELVDHETFGPDWACASIPGSELCFKEKAAVPPADAQ